MPSNAASSTCTTSNTTTRSSRSGMPSGCLLALRWLTGARRLCQWRQPALVQREPSARSRDFNRLAPTPASRLAKRRHTSREKGVPDRTEQLLGTGSRDARSSASLIALAAIARDYPPTTRPRPSKISRAARVDSAEHAASRLLAQGWRARECRAEAQLSASRRCHYVLHAYDDGEHAAMALPAARSCVHRSSRATRSTCLLARLPAARHVGSREV